MIVPLEKFNYLKSKPKTYKRKDIEMAMNRLFCKDCSTTIVTKNPNRPNLIILKVGNFDNPSVLKKTSQYLLLINKIFIILRMIKNLLKKPY